jgi:hypothetical protein
VRDVFPLVHILWHEGQRASASSIVEWLDLLLQPAVATCVGQGAWDALGHCAVVVPMLRMPNDPASAALRFREAREVAIRIKDDSIRADTLALLANFETDALAPPPPGPSLAIESEMYAQMAGGLGVRLADTSQEADDLRLGLKDMNPERVLRNCTYLYVKPGALTPLGKAILLLTAGDKVLRCTLYGYGDEGAGPGRGLREIPCEALRQLQVRNAPPA